MANEIIPDSIASVVQKYKNRAVVMMELPTDNYFEAGSMSVKVLTDSSFSGIYISFHRPFKNIASLLTNIGININKLLFIDVATAFAEEIQEKDPRCVHISPDIDIDELVRAIYTSLVKLKGRKKFIYIDSITTITLYKPLSETMRFSEFLIRTVKKEDMKETTLIFNVAKDLVQKRFIKDIAFHVDEVIRV